MIHIVSEGYKSVCEAMTSSLRKFGGKSDETVDDASILHRLYDDVQDYFDDLSNFRISNDKLLFKKAGHSICIKFNSFDSKLTLLTTVGEHVIFDASHNYGEYLDQVVAILNDIE